MAKGGIIETPDSIIHSAPFRARQLRSERVRCLLLGSAWLVILGLLVLRRVTGGDLLHDSIFLFSASVMASAASFQVLGYVLATRLLRSGREPAPWRIAASAAIDLAFPLVALAGLEFLPGGERANGLAAPAVLVVALVLALSILRLRPAASLFSGIGAWLGHWAIVAFSIRAGHVDRYHVPTFLAYGVAFAILGAGCAFVAAQVRAYVSEAIVEARVAEQKERELAQVTRDLAVAREIQMGLMPAEPPSLSGFDIAGMARPAQETGGDYYDWEPLPDGRVLASIADVTGHGIGPALVMAVCRAYARAAAPAIPEPALLLGHLNRLICSDLGQTGRFITMATAVLSPTGKIHLISAGHGPSLVYRASSGQIETFAGNGIPLGIDPGERYGPVMALALGPGDIMVLLTDGFIEWKRRTDGQQWGIDRLAQAVRESAGRSAHEILDHIDACVQRFSDGSPQLDDTTAMVIKRIAAGA